MHSKRLRRALIFAAIVVAVFLVAAIVFARPGGGQSYSGSSGGGSSSSGGGGGGDDDSGFLIALLVLAIEHPTIGIPLLILFAIITIVKRMSQSKEKKKGWETSNLATVEYRPPAHHMPAAQAAVTRRAIASLAQGDPDFSVVLFEDFVTALYSDLHRSRARGNVASLAAYLSPAVQSTIGGDPTLETIQGVVIGSMRYLSLHRDGPMDRVEIEVEANLSEVRQQREQRFYVKDCFTISRAKGAKSRPPARSRTLDCPNCGAPLQAVRGDTCTYCKQHVGGGRFDWTVESFRNTERETRGPLLWSDVEEQGNELPTVTDPTVTQALAQLNQKDPSFQWNAFLQRVGLVFNEFQAGWTMRDLSRVRPFVSDNLFQTQQYWIDLYLQARARNVIENPRIVRVDPSSLISDKYYDALTARVFAMSLDYTMGDDGRHLSGHRTKPRAYTEYWTLIRGSTRRGPTKTTPNCSNCGAPLKVSMVGNCEYCKVKVTTGDFDWVLSRIEQDDNYTG